MENRALVIVTKTKTIFDIDELERRIGMKWEDIESYRMVYGRLCVTTPTGGTINFGPYTEETDPKETEKYLVTTTKISKAAVDRGGRNT